MEKNNYAVNRMMDFIEREDASVLFLDDPFNSLNQSSFGISLIKERYGQSFFYHQFSTYIISEPYEPFLGIIEKMYKEYYEEEMSVNRFLEACGVYELQKKTFSSYIKRGKAIREEDIIISEVDYELEQVRRSIISALKYICEEHKIVLVLARTNYGMLSSASIINELLKGETKVNIKIIVSYNDADIAYDFCKPLLEQMISKAVANGDFIDYTPMDVKGIIREDTESMIIQRIPLEKSHITEYNRRLNNLYYFFALDDLEYYVNHIYSRIQDEKVRMSLNDAFAFYYIGALCYVLKGNVNYATILSNRLSSLYDKKREPERDFDYNYVCYQLHLSMNQYELCEKYALTCMDIARKIDDEVIILRAVVLYYEAIYNGWSNMFASHNKSVDIDFEFINTLKEYNFRNTLAHYYIYAFDNSEEAVDNYARGESSKYYDEAMDIVYEINNMELALSAYTKNIIVLNNRGFFEKAYELYDKKQEILKDLDNPKREADLYLERGYSCILTEDFVGAEADFTNAIHILYQLRNPEKVSEALYNVALNRICAYDFKEALKMMEVLFEVLEDLGIRSVQLCSQSKLIALNALVNYMVGNDYKCYLEIKKIKRLTEIIEGEGNNTESRPELREDTYLYYLLTALLDKRNKSYEKALISFKIAHEYMNELSSIVFYSSAVFYTQYYELLNLLDMKKEAAELLVEALCHCERYGFERMQELINKFAYGEELTPMIKEEPYTSFAITRMLGLAKDIGKDRQIAKQKKDILFLSSWQELLGRDQVDRATLLGDSLNSFQDNFNLDRMLLFTINNGKYNVEFSSVKIDNPEELFGKISSFFMRNKNEFMTSCVDRDYSVYSIFADALNSHGAYSLIGIPIFSERHLSGAFVASLGEAGTDAGLLTSDDLAIMKTAIIQVEITLERLENKEKMLRINEKLNKLAITDQLTGLYNRQGLMEVLEDISISNYMTTVIYIDLDNFKYYNDSFGHETGDMILYHFAKLLKEVVHSDDYVIRYGGDEFVILLCSDDTDTAKIIVKKIFDGMETGTLKKLIDADGKEESVPKEMRLSCSIGIAKAKGSDKHQIYEALQHADRSLYDIKRTTKRNYKVWEENN